jgi:hypothetical protein
MYSMLMITFWSRAWICDTPIDPRAKYPMSALSASPGIGRGRPPSTWTWVLDSCSSACCAAAVGVCEYAGSLVKRSSMTERESREVLLDAFQLQTFSCVPVSCDDGPATPLAGSPSARSSLAPGSEQAAGIAE